MRGNHFNVLARPRAIEILEDFGKCMVIPIDYGGELLEPIMCKELEEIEDLYNENYDIIIDEPNEKNNDKK